MALGNSPIEGGPAVFLQENKVKQHTKKEICVIGVRIDVSKVRIDIRGKRVNASEVLVGIE